MYIHVHPKVSSLCVCVCGFVCLCVWEVLGKVRNHGCVVCDLFVKDMIPSAKKVWLHQAFQAQVPEDLSTCLHVLLQFEGEGRLAFTASYFVDGALVVPPIEIEAGHVLFCTWRILELPDTRDK